MAVVSSNAPPLTGPRIMRQDWTELTFLHWAADPELVAPFMPSGVRPDVLDGVTFVGLVPFVMRRAGLGRGPAIPWAGDFAETNVRLYSVDDRDRHGVVFRSLEASRLLVTLGARAAFATPYTWARMRVGRDRDVVEYSTRRRWPSPRGVGGTVRVRVGATIDEPSELERFVTARFGLHTQHLGRSWWIPIEHAPWPLRRAELLHLDDDLVAAAGLPGVVDRPPDSVMFGGPVHTAFGLPRLLER